MNSHRLGFAIVAALAFVLAGCGKTASQSSAEAAVAAATAGRVQVNESGGQRQVTMKDDQGNEMHMNSGDNVALPKDFPSDVHLPSSYTIKTTMIVAAGTVIGMHTPASGKAVFSDYDSSMKSDGWTEAMAIQNTDKESVLSFQKGKRTVMVTISASSDDGADVNLQLLSDAQ